MILSAKLVVRRGQSISSRDAQLLGHLTPLSDIDQIVYERGLRVQDRDTVYK